MFDIASLAGLPAKYGLYTAFFPAVIYFMLGTQHFLSVALHVQGSLMAPAGTSKQLSIGPDALSSLLVGIILSNSAVAGNLPTEVVTAFGFLVGSLLLGLGLIRVGFLDNILSRPLLSGFVNAVAVTIIMEQIDTLTGIDLVAIATESFPPDAVGTPAFDATAFRAEEHGWRKVVAVLQNIRSAEWGAIIFGAICILLLLIVRLLKTKFSESKIKFLPETLIIVAGATILTGTLRLDEKFSINILGDVDSKMDPPRVPSFSIILSDTTGFYLNSAILVVVVGFIEHVVVAKVYADKHNYLVSPNREFVALGATNMVGSFFNCYPTFGSLPRSSLADSLGAVSQFFSLVSAIFILLTILLMGPLFYYLPKVVMSAIIVVASLGLFEFHDVIFLYQLRAWTDLGLLALTFGLTVGLGIELGIFASLGISILQLIRHTTYPPVTILVRVNDGHPFAQAVSELIRDFLGFAGTFGGHHIVCGSQKQ
jgi:MFS superfamily sulfate permease-like transporter